MPRDHSKGAARLSSLWAGLRRHRGRKGRPGRLVAGKGASPAALELLEPRVLMSTIVVNSLGDDTNTDGLVTLREASQAANTDTSVDGSAQGSGADEITFDPGLF